MFERRTARGGALVRPPRAVLGAVLAAGIAGSLAALPTAGAGAAQATVKALPAPQVESLLGKAPLSALEAGALAELLGGLPGLEGIEPKALERSLTETIEAMAGKGEMLEALLSGEEAATLVAGKLEAALGPVLWKALETLLAGNPLATLEGALETTSPQAVLGELLASSEAPAALAEQVLGAIEPAALEALLGSPLGGEPVSGSTAGELAAKAGTTVQALAEGLGLEPADLPGSALALTKPLNETLTLGLLDGTNGLTLGLLERTAEEAKEVLGGGITGGGSGGAGGAGGSSPGATVLVLGSSPLPPAPHPIVAGKVKVLSRRVRDRRATVVVQVPGAGLLTTFARGVRRVRRETSHAERVTLHLALTAAGTAALRRGRRRLAVTLRVSFQPAGGAASTARTALSFH